MREEQGAALVEAEGHEGRARRDPPALGHGQRAESFRPADAPGGERVQEMLPDGERRVVARDGGRNESLRHLRAEALRVARRARAEPGDDTGEAPKPRREALGQGRRDKERLEPEGVEGRGGEDEARPLEELAEPRLAREGQTMPAALERGQRRHGLEDVAEGARMDHESLDRPSHRAYYERGLGQVACQTNPASSAICSLLFSGAGAPERTQAVMGLSA